VIWWTETILSAQAQPGLMTADVQTIIFPTTDDRPLLLGGVRRAVFIAHSVAADEEN